MYCGLKMFDIALHVEHAGRMLQNHHRTIFCTAYLCNAAVQDGLLERRWPEMDLFIELHMKSVFAGKLPDAKYDYHTLYILHIGPFFSKIREKRQNQQSAQIHR